MYSAYDIAIKSLIVSGVILAALLVVRKRSASLKSYIVDCGLFLLLAMPLISLLGLFEVTQQNIPVTVLPDYSAQLQELPPVSTNTYTGIVDLTEVMSIIYVIGAGVLLLRLLFGVLRLKSFAKIEASDGDFWQIAFDKASKKIGYNSKINLLLNPNLNSPVSWGIIRPTIMVSQSTNLSAIEAEAIIMHELAHIKRMDWIRTIVTHIVQAVFWFNPIVWLLVKNASQLREEAVDDMVINAQFNGPDYAQMLVDMARAEFRPKFIMANGVMQNENGLKARIGRILNSRVNRNSINNKAIFIVLLALFASVGVVGTALSFSDGTYYGPADKLNEDVKLSSNSKQPSILYKNDNFVSYEKLNPQERAEVDEVIKESSIALKQAEEHKVRAFAEAERAKSEAIAEAETNKNQAIAEAEQAKREALADVEEARRDAEQAKLEALADIEDARREALADAEEAKREAMIASKQHYNLSNVISSGKNTSVSTTIDKNGTKRIVSTAGNATVTTIIEKNGNKTTISKIGDKVSVVRNNP
jgi:beta-lactamase regulating signal transducer with metallopeptidase domain